MDSDLYKPTFVSVRITRQWHIPLILHNRQELDDEAQKHFVKLGGIL